MEQSVDLNEEKLLKDLLPAVEIVSEPEHFEDARMVSQFSGHYVTSFSKNGDALSQWLSYCPRGNGFSIGFDPDCLRTANEGASLEEVKYFSSSDPESSWRHMLDYYITEPQLAIEAMKAAAPFIKDVSFFREEEFRLVQNNPEPTRICFRPGRSMVIPYIEFTLRKDPGFVKEIIVGPCPTPALSIKSVKLLLASWGYSNVTVRESSVPYRDW